MRHIEVLRVWVLAGVMQAAWGGAVLGENWPRFRGPDGAGLSEVATIPTRITQADYRWKVSLPGGGHSSPVVWEDRVFVTVGDADGGRRIVCLNAADGATRWEREDSTRPYAQHQFNSFAASTPAADERGVYIAWTTDTAAVVWALDHEGNDLWRREVGAFTAQHGSGASPVVMGEVVVIANDHEGDGSFITGLDRRTGQTVWRHPRRSSRASYVTPAVYTPANGEAQLIYSSTSHGLTSLDPATGNVNWEVNPPLTERCVGSPVVAGDVIFAAAGSGGAGKESIAVRVDPQRPSAPPSIAWEYRKGLPYVPTPVAVDGLLFLWNEAGIVTCLRAATGEEVWKERIGGRYFGSPVCVGGHLYAMSMDGELVVLAAGDRFEIVSRHDLGEGSQATPAVSNGVMYLRTERHVVAVGG